MTAATLPESVAALVGDLVGCPFNILPLSGMSGSRVLRVVGPSGSIVVKGGVSSREATVYRSLAPVLADAGIRIPSLVAATDRGGEAWLLLEDIPTALPPDRWLADPELLGALHRLHCLDPTVLDVLPDRFQPDWSESMTNAALHWLGDDPEVGRRLTDLRGEAAPLFEPVTLISGDPNPLNWGLSGTGELVLMDWERIGLGHPAIDVAITMPGLPGLEQFDRVVVTYRSTIPILAVSSPPIATYLLVRAKLWTVIELLAATPPLSVGAPECGPLARRQETVVGVSGLLKEWLRRVT